MSHADDGTLHAYLDGELSALQVVRLEAHLRDCAACQGRLADERTLIGRASDLLAAAMPPERAAPPLDTLRPRRRRWRVGFPLAAAATVIVALAGVWFARPPTRKAEQHQVAEPIARAPESAALETASVASAPPPAELQAAAESEVAGGRAEAPAQAMARRDTVQLPVAQAAPLALRGEAAPAAARSATEAAPSGVQLYPGSLTLDEARALLGGDIHAVPGRPITAIRRARLSGYSPVVVVEQALDASRTLQVIHRRPMMDGGQTGVSGVDTAAPGDSVAAARDAMAPQGALKAAGAARATIELEVRGPLPQDSLDRLRAALQPRQRR